MYNHFMLQSQYWQSSSWTWICVRQAGSYAVDSRVVKNILFFCIFFLGAACQSLTPPEATWLYKYSRGMESLLMSKTNVTGRKRTPARASVYIWDAWILPEPETRSSRSERGRLGGGEVVPGGGTGAHSLCAVYPREAGYLSCHPSRLPAGAEGARLRLLHGLRSGERSVLRSSHGPLWWGPPLHSETRWGQTSTRSYQRTGGLHRGPGPR